MQCDICKSEGFEKSITGKGCSFCDGTEYGHPPLPVYKCPSCKYVVVESVYNAIQAPHNKMLCDRCNCTWDCFTKTWI